MQTKKTLTASLVVFVLFIVLDFLLHGILLRDLYAATASLWRPAESIAGLAWIIWVVDALMAILFVWLYGKGREEGKSWLGQGIRFGIALGLFFALPMGFSMYAIMPIPFTLALGWFAGALAETVIVGIATAYMLRS